MSSVSLPVTRPTGRALLVGAPECRVKPLGLLQEIGFVCLEADDPYAAMAELSRRPQIFRAMVLSLQSVYREELDLIATIKRRFPHVEVWVTDTDGRQAAMADAMRQGADGLLAEDGLHRVALASTAESGRSNGSKRARRTGRPGRTRKRPAEPLAAPLLAPLTAEPASAPVWSAESVAPPAPPAQVAPPSPAEPIAPTPAAARQEHRGNGAAESPKHSRTDVFVDVDDSLGDPVLTAEELRALLHEPPGSG